MLWKDLQRNAVKLGDENLKISKKKKKKSQQSERMWYSGSFTCAFFKVLHSKEIEIAYQR